jgi:L-alanine-DL-glutamate epimerase-like enolase superfamily enzyme
MAPGGARDPRPSDAVIVDARLRVLRVPVDDPIAMSFAPLRARSMVLVEVETADGLVGYGESWVNHPPWAPTERVATLREGVFPLILGADARAISDLHRRLCAALEPIGRQWGAPGPVMQAISAVDMALWDLRGRAAGLSIGALAGGRLRDRIAVYASSLGPDGVAEQADALRRAGYHAVKVKVGFGRERDEANLAAARAGCGANMRLYADANQAWTLAEAVSMAPVLSAYDVAWIEEPVRGDRLADIEQFHAATGMPVATGENLYGHSAFAAYAASPAIAVLQPDIAKTGGLTEALAICELAEKRGTAVMPHLYGGAVAFAATLQLAACAASVSAIEYDVRQNPLRDPLLVDPPHPVDGVLELPDAPGLGLVLDTAAVAAAQEPSPLIATRDPDRRPDHLKEIAL